MLDLDSFDIALLSALQENNRLTSDVLAERVGLSATACQRRMKRLRDSGAILKDIAVLNPDLLGVLTLIVNIEINGGQRHRLDMFKRDMMRLAEVQQCYYVTGSTDFVLIVTAANIAAYERFTRQHFFAHQAIARFSTLVVMETVKAGLAIPLLQKG